MTGVVDQAFGQDWAFYCGDSTEVLAGLPADSIDLSVYSPPFSQLYTYSPSERDLGNSASDAEFFEHFFYVIGEVLRVTKPGRVTCVHVADIPAMLARDGYIGLKDFSGDVIRAYIAVGWTFDGRVPIDKNQQAQSIRTHAKGLTMTQMEKDRTWSRPALPDYILKFRKPGENRVPVFGGDVSRDTWIEWANPSWPNEHDRCGDAGAFATWYGIKENKTLNVQAARSADDERHICPLQLPTIERCIRLWSNPGETVLDPFGGIASTGHEAVRLGRHFVGVELKPQYWRVGVTNLRRAETVKVAPTLDSALAEAIA
jgi:DNA modification methylase